MILISKKMKKLRMFNFFSHDWNLSVWFFCIIFWKLCNHFPTEIWNLSLKKMNVSFSFDNQNSKCRKFRHFEDNPLTPIFNHSKFAIFEEKPIPTLEAEFLYDLLHEVLGSISLQGGYFPINFFIQSYS